MEPEYIDRAHYCKHICKCNRDKCDRSACPIWSAPSADVAPRAEVAEQIFAEIRLCWASRLFDCDDFSYKDFAFEDFAGDLDELYKKYTGEQT